MMFYIIDILEIGIAFLAVIISAISIYNTLKNSQIQTELQVYQMLSEEKRNFSSTMLKAQMMEATEQDTNLAIAIVTENLCNAYDVFCGNYIDKYISRKRFERIYAKEVMNWVEMAEQKGVYEGKKEEYHDTFEVYQILKNKLKK